MGYFHLSVRLIPSQTCCDCDHGLKTIYFKLHVWESGVRFDSKIKSMSKCTIASAIISKIIPEQIYIQMENNYSSRVLMTLLPNIF